VIFSAVITGAADQRAVAAARTTCRQAANRALFCDW
jgi:hypothetical protein